MQEQNKKLFRWVLGSGIVCIALSILGILIVKLIFGGNTQQYNTYVTCILAIMMFVYLAIAGVAMTRYNKYLKNYEMEKLEKTKKELTSEYKPVFLKYSDTISPEMFKCRVKVDENGEIVCEIKLDHKVKFESYKEFLRHFDLPEE